MGLKEIIPSIALILVLILVLPGFIKSNFEKRVFLKNLSIWLDKIFGLFFVAIALLFVVELLSH